MLYIITSLNTYPCICALIEHSKAHVHTVTLCYGSALYTDSGMHSYGAVLECLWFLCQVGMAHQQHHDQVCDTANYVWSTRDKLSHGANAPVYVGYIKVCAHVLYSCMCACMCLWRMGEEYKIQFHCTL